MTQTPIEPTPNSDAGVSSGGTLDETIDLPDTQLYSESYFVVLTGGQPEEILTAAELEAKLAAILTTFPVQDLPRPVQQVEAIADRVRLLIDTTCELTFDSGDFMQWYAVRLEKNTPD
jgi:hypothetical protein